MEGNKEEMKGEEQEQMEEGGEDEILPGHLTTFIVLKAANRLPKSCFKCKTGLPP